MGEYNGLVETGDTAVDRAGDLVTAAAYLHAFMRLGEFVVGANATEYSPFDPRALAFGRMHPRFDLFRTWAAHAGTRPLAATVETPVAQQPRRVGRDVLPIFNLPLVDGRGARRHGRRGGGGEPDQPRHVAAAHGGGARRGRPGRAAGDVVRAPGHAGDRRRGARRAGRA